jgi:5-methyltetrahydrofolate--homocysteine methyltransferase
LNSVTGEEERLEIILPMVKKYGAAVIGISNDDSGISQDINVRYEVAKKIVERASDHGIPKEDVLIDPLVMPIGAINQAGKQVMALVRRLREELQVNTTCGASNLSFGLPNRHGLNATFLPMAISSGMACAITNPMDKEIMQAVRGANVIIGQDPECNKWIKHYREPAEGQSRRKRSRRRRSRS